MSTGVKAALEAEAVFQGLPGQSPDLRGARGNETLGDWWRITRHTLLSLSSSLRSFRNDHGVSLHGLIEIFNMIPHRRAIQVYN